jgi:hypothetical protein
MKKPSLLLLLLILSLIAQSQVQLGVKGGYFFYTVTGQNDHEPSKYAFSPDSYLLSAEANQRSSSIFNVGIGLEYLTRSYDVDSHEVSPGHSTNGHYHVRFSQINLLIRPQLVFGHKVRFFICPGMYLGYLVNTNVKGTSATYTMSNYYTDTINGSGGKFFEKFAVGLMLGFGIEIPLHTGFYIVCENNNSYNFGSGVPGGSDHNRFVDMKFEAGIAYTFQSRKKEKGK